jgi:hypothetical protein
MATRELYESYVEIRNGQYGRRLKSPRWVFTGWGERPPERFLQKETKLFWIYDFGDTREKYRKPTDWA